MKKTLLLITGLLAAPHASLGSGLSPCLGQKSRPDPVGAVALPSSPCRRRPVVVAPSSGPRRRVAGRRSSGRWLRSRSGPRMTGPSRC